MKRILIGTLRYMKRLVIGAIALIGLFIAVVLAANVSPVFGLVVSAALLVFGMVAVVRPLPRIGLGHRGFSFLMALLVGLVGVLGSSGLMMTAHQESAELANSRPDSSAEQVEGESPAETVGTNEGSSEDMTVDAADAPSDTGPSGPVHVQARHWETHCEPRCRTFTLADFRGFSGSPPTKLVLEIDPDRKLLVSALDTEAQHRKFYTNQLPVELRHGSVNYVPSMYFFDKRSSADLTIDGSTAARLSAHDESHLGGELTDALLERLRAGTRAELVFEGQRVTFSLLGFTRAYEARVDAPAAPAAVAPDPRSVVAAALKGNKFGLMPEGLRQRQNPRGEGAFVFFPEMEIAGHERLFVWFVNADQAVALNGASKTATPSLPFPRDVSFRFWTDTELSIGDVTSTGLAVAFE